MRSARLLVVSLLVVCSPVLFAQWSQPDASGNISNTNSGNVGIGTGTPTAKLTIFGSGSWGAAGAAQLNLKNTSTSNVFSFHVANTGVLQIVDEGGNTKIAASAGANGSVNLFAGTGGVLLSTGTLTVGTPSAGAIQASEIGNSAGDTVGKLVFNYNTANIDFWHTHPSEGVYRWMVGGAEKMRLNRTGDLTIAGNITATGSITGVRVLNAVYQDIAEWVPATEDLAPGTVVILNPASPNEVRPSATAYDTTVAGVVSAQPGVLLGVGGEGKEQIATTGRVRVRVDARQAPIKIGDLLVTSNVAGTAMKSEPMEIGGRKFHQPGTLIGKALEPLEGGVGEILVLLSLQ